MSGQLITTVVGELVRAESQLKIMFGFVTVRDKCQDSRPFFLFVTSFVTFRFVR